MVLAGRERELGELNEVFESAVLGQGGVAVISGPMGSGRTVLLHEFGRLAAQAGARVLSAECSPAERSLAGGVVGQLLGATGRPGSRGWPDLLEMAQDVPTVLAIDDVDWADDVSLDILLSVVRRSRTARLLVVMTTSPDRRPISPVPAAEELLHRPYNRRVELTPLSPAAVWDLIAERMGRPPADWLADDSHRLAGESPLLVRAILEDLEKRGETRSLEVGAAFGDAVVACIHRCEATVIRVAEAIAVLGEHANTGMVSELAGVEAHQAERVTERLERAGLLSGGRFRHEVGRRAVIDRMPATRRTRLHRLAAQLLYIAGRPVTDVAACLLTAGWSGENWAARVLVAAGRRQLHDEAPVAAARCFELALASGSADAKRLVRKALLAETEGRLAPTDASLRLAELLHERLPESHATDTCHRLSRRERPAAPYDGTGQQRAPTVSRGPAPRTGVELARLSALNQALVARVPRHGCNGTPYPASVMKSTAARDLVERITRPADPAGQPVATTADQAPPDEESSGDDTPAGDLGSLAEVLSEAEHRVAVRAAQGRTNREIAEDLYITRSTVEQHLTRIYRKLQVRTREDLGRLAAAISADEDDSVPC
ncbi:AAA family ATPase [Nonomuraea sp. NN258]|uniref:AAA family ATPase n=1 Tax=Nonomuraea antri TaxID=2730852 RepID=UPI001568D505|nr:AAA family ATPase [Nonomuraea antri]NRQ31696.1 AAA family ATPase [Nonomuraea antri]